MRINPSELFASATEQYEYLLSCLTSLDYQAMEHGEIETFLECKGRELLRRLFQGHLDLRAVSEVTASDVVGSDGERRPHRRQGCQRQLESLFGEVMVNRSGYSTKQVGVSALYPADGKLNLPVDQYSDGVRQRVAIEASKVSFAETSTTISQTTGAQVGKRQCEELTVKVAQDFEDFYAQRSQEQHESSQDLLVLTSDGKGIVMHESDLRQATAKAAKEASQQQKTRLSPGEKRQRKRMATVASVYSTPRYERQAEEIIGDQRDPPPRPEIVNKRVWASVRQDAKSVIASVFEEACQRDPQHQREWVALVDGEAHQLDTIHKMAKQQNVEVTIVLDFIHVLEYVWKAALCFFGSGSEQAEIWVRERALRASGHFEEYWQFHKSQEFKRNHLSKFQDPERLLAA